MTQTEKTGLGIAVAVHVLLFAALSFQFRDTSDASFANPPIAVDIIAETAAVSTAPAPSVAPPAARLGDPDSREIAPPPPADITPPAPAPAPAPVTPRVMPEPRPAPRTEPRPAPRATPRPTPAPRVERRPDRPAQTRPTPPRQTAQNSTPSRVTPSRPAQSPAAPARPARDPRPTGALDGIAAGVARETRPNARAAAPPAAATASAIRADIRVSINAEVRNPWNGCRVTGIDVDQLTTTVVFRLTEAGGLDRFVSVNTRGVNDSNRPQLQRFEECARRAIQVAAPFALPPEHYSFWQTYTLDFEKR